MTKQEFHKALWALLFLALTQAAGGVIAVLLVKTRWLAEGGGP